MLKKSLQLSYEALRFATIRANYYAGNYKNIVWLIGDGRSGTTFVSNLINWNHRYREMFEPFHPIFVKQMTDLSFHQYIRPGDVDRLFAGIASEVLTGRLSTSFIDVANKRLVYQDLLIKDIFANLFAFWAYQTFANLNIKVVLLLRNPFAVALSKYKKKHWHWMTDPRDFLKQKELMDDYLAPFEDIIRKIGDDYIERQVLIWSIINYVPLRQFGKDQIYVLFYEDMITQPKQELSRLFDYINPNMDPTAVNQAMQKLTVPSRVSGSDSNINKGKSPIVSWREEISPVQLLNGTQILEKFGLKAFYGDDCLPNRSALDNFLQS